MNTWLKRMATVLMALHVGAAWAGQSPWTLRLGMSYREFDDVSFSDSVFRNWGQANGAGPWGVQNILTAPGNPIGDPVILDEVMGGGGSQEMDNDSRFAPILGLRYDLYQTGRIQLAVVGNFQYFRIGADGDASGSASAPGDFTDNQYQHYVLDLAGTLTPGAPLIGPALPGTAFAVHNQFDMDLYVLDIGLEARTELGCFVNVFLALGPTLTFADADSSQSQEASWQAQGPGLPAGSYEQESGDSSSDFLLGAYAALGLSFDLTESWSLAMECRYDYVHGDAGTDQAEVDLSGYGGAVFLQYRF
jgi:opacity protein-like surface antigen